MKNNKLIKFLFVGCLFLNIFWINKSIDQNKEERNTNTREGLAKMILTLVTFPVVQKLIDNQKQTNTKVCISKTEIIDMAFAIIFTDGVLQICEEFSPLKTIWNFFFHKKTK